MKSETGNPTFSSARMLLGVMLVAAPLPFGSVYTWAWASLAVLTLLVLLLWMLGSIQEGELRIGYSPLYVPVALFLVLGFVQLWSHLTSNPIATRESLLKLAADFALFFVVIQLFSFCAAETWRRTGIAVLAFGFLFSFLSILQFLWNPGRIVWVDHPVGGPFGPYVDRDHYAGLMEMLVPVSASYALSLRKRDPLRGILGFAVVVQVLSLLLTGSRAGFVSVMVEIAILGWVIIRRNHVPGRRMRGAVVGLGFLAVSTLFFWLVPSFVLTKLGTLNNYVPEVREGRLTLWKNSLGIVRDHPWLGSGMGSFVTVYPPYQTDPSDLITEHAHNDYIEALTESGLLGGVVMVAALALFFQAVWRKLVVPLSDVQDWIQMGAAIACCGLLIHSVADFNLHIPANALWFVFCAGLTSLCRPRASSRQNVRC